MTWRAPRDGGYHPSESTPEPTNPPAGSAGAAGRRGAYGVPIPDGLCGFYWADEGGEHMCRRPLGHRGDHHPNGDALPGDPICMCTDAERADGRCKVPCPPEWIDPPPEPPEPPEWSSWLAGEDTEPYATVARSGRFIWYITVTHGITQWGPDGGGWFCIGSRARADRKAARKLSAYRRSLIREASAHRVTGDGGR